VKFELKKTNNASSIIHIMLEALFGEFGIIWRIREHINSYVESKIGAEKTNNASSIKCTSQ